MAQDILRYAKNLPETDLTDLLGDDEEGEGKVSKGADESNDGPEDAATPPAERVLRTVTLADLRTGNYVGVVTDRTKVGCHWRIDSSTASELILLSKLTRLKESAVVSQAIRAYAVAMGVDVTRPRLPHPPTAGSPSRYERQEIAPGAYLGAEQPVVLPGSPAAWPSAEGTEESTQ
jgi:hypothetical protein